MILRLREGFLEGSLPARDDVQQGVLEHHVLIMLGQAACGNGTRPAKSRSGVGWLGIAGQARPRRVAQALH